MTPVENHTLALVLWILLSAALIVVAVIVAIRLGRRSESARKNALRGRLREILRLTSEMDTPAALVKAPLSDLERNETLSENGKAALETARLNLDKLLALVKQVEATGRMGMNTGTGGHESPSHGDAVPAGARPSASGQPGATLLIAGPLAEIVDYLAGTLSLSYEVLTASDTEQAWSVADEKSPDLLMLVSSDSGTTGAEFCRRLKSTVTTSHIPVILISARDDREHIVSALEAGVDDYIVRPFDMSVLRMRIRNILEERERLRAAFAREGRKSDKLEFANRLDREFMDRLSGIIEKELDNSELAVNDLCREVGMSRTAFYNKLKSLTGQGPNDFVRNYRLTKARELLEGGLYSVAEVSDMVGFSDPKYFSVCFKKAFGASPSRI